MQNSEVDSFKIANSSFIHEDGKIIFSDGNTHQSEAIINIDNITMIAKKGEDKSIIHFVSGDSIIIDKPFSQTVEFIGQHSNFLGSIKM